MSVWFALGACRGRGSRDTSDAQTTQAQEMLQGVPTVVPVRAMEGSQPRWRYLARGERPRGHERWRLDLTPKEPFGEPATDGRTVYVSIVKQEPEGPSDGEVLALDLRDGTIRWRTPVAGLHGEPVELMGDVVVLDTTTHCLRRGPETPGMLLRRCEETAPGGVVGLDPATGRQRFRTAISSDVMRSRWTTTDLRGTLWIHDGLTAVRALTPPVGTLGTRLNLNATVTNLAAHQSDLLLTTVGRSGLTRVMRRTPTAQRPTWERMLPQQTHCALVVLGNIVVLPGFYTGALSGAARALNVSSGVDVWIDEAPTQRVSTCGAIENGVFWQSIDNQLVGLSVTDGQTRSRHPVAWVATHDLTVLMNDIFYLSAPGRLVGMDVNDGTIAVSVDTGARASEGLVIWGGLGVVATREPGLVVGFE
jgi:outer membrane protein assembly factor BamB